MRSNNNDRGMGDDFKAIGKKLFKKALGIDSVSDATPSTSSPPRPPTKPTTTTPYSHSVNNNNSNMGGLVQSFDALALSNQNPQSISAPFIGGFTIPSQSQPTNVNLNSNSNSNSYLPNPYDTNPSSTPPAPAPNSITNYTNYPSYSSPGPLPRPPAMPTPFAPPTSLTMQYALQQSTTSTPFPPPLNTPPSRPVSTSVLPSPHQDLLLSSSPPHPALTPSKPKPHAPPIKTSNSSGSTSTSVSKPTKPTKPDRRRASSDPNTPISPSSSTKTTDTIQCSGTTKTGKRCTRQVKANLTSGIDAKGEVFCHQHSKEVLAPSGFYARKNGVWVKFEDWIPSYLQPDTQVILRSEMEKVKSASDVEGYIYTFEILEPSSPTIKLKVGRAVNLVKRIDEWSKQCSSKEQVLRGWYPGVVEPDTEDDDDDNDGIGNGNNGNGGGGVPNTSLLKGKVRAGPKGPLCHRLERLVHLELADLAFSEPYLDPAWPRVGSPPFVGDKNGNGNGSGSATPKKGSRGRGYIKPCPDCGQLHQEIFEFTRVKKGRYKNKEWELIVKPVIEKWGAFVESYV